jgi:hypothetical protein
VEALIPYIVRIFCWHKPLSNNSNLIKYNSFPLGNHGKDLRSGPRLNIASTCCASQQKV